MKNTMNSRDVSRYHKMLKQDVKLSEISAVLKVSKKALLKFSPEKVEAAAKARKAKIQAQAKAKDENKAKASVVAEAVTEALNKEEG